MIIEPKQGPTWEDERGHAMFPGGRWHTILSVLSDKPRATGELLRLLRNQELTNRADKYRLWASLEALQKLKLVIRKGGPVIITPTGRQALINWNKGDFSEYL
jgi:hypothetical protein